AGRKLITRCLRQERRDGLGGGGAIVMQIAAAERPLRVFGPLGAEPKPAGIAIVLDQVAGQEAGGVLRKRDVELVELAPPGELVIAQERPAGGDLVRQTQR